MAFQHLGDFMKRLFSILLCTFATTAFAAETSTTSTANTTSLKTDVIDIVEAKATNLTDLSFQYSSLNDGTAFAGVGLMHEWMSGVALGVRGYLPLQYTRNLQMYMGEIALRLMIQNDLTQMYFEPTLTQGFFNDNSGQSSFGMAGLGYGFSRQINKQFSVGALLGVEYSGARIRNDQVTYGTPTFYNKIALTGGYYF